MIYWKNSDELFPWDINDNTITDYRKDLVDRENPKVFMKHPPVDFLVCAEDALLKSSW